MKAHPWPPARVPRTDILSLAGPGRQKWGSGSVSRMSPSLLGGCAVARGRSPEIARAGRSGGKRC